MDLAASALITCISTNYNKYYYCTYNSKKKRGRKGASIKVLAKSYLAYSAKQKEAHIIPWQDQANLSMSIKNQSIKYFT